MSRDVNGNGVPARNATSSEKDDGEPPSKRTSKKIREDSDVDTETDKKHRSSRKKARESSDSDSDSDKRRSRKRKSRRRYRSDSDSESDSGSDSDSESDESERSGSDSEYSGSESETVRKERKKKKEKRRRREREEEKRRRRKEKEKKQRKKEKEEERRKKEKRKEKKKEKKERGKKGAVTNLWGKYGIIRETDMWRDAIAGSREGSHLLHISVAVYLNFHLQRTKRPEFTAWLSEVKLVNMEHLSNWEEKQMFKEFMEDHNTATFPSKKYYSLDAYYRRQMEKEMKKGFKQVKATERTVFNDEEQRRQELLRAREKHKEEQVIALKREMESGMAQAMKEQAQLREEMAYQYKLGNFEAAAAIQRRLDPDAAV
ncbi:nucleolar protein 58-like [Trifolium pratense]|uniref:Nucleolar protein 58-like n=1 Tax=Trifolium pratense TaxID=57577 RepID=A0A2K3NTG2_TRIPR|nr:nucleolar protein 58-like [Trifolium pratense]